jgi:hypothetical protein
MKRFLALHASGIATALADSSTFYANAKKEWSLEAVA